MTILKNCFKRMFRSKLSLLLILVLPPLMISLVFGVAVGETSVVHVGFVDQDQTWLTKHLKEVIGNNVAITALREEEINQMLSEGRVSLVLKLEKGFAEELIAGKDPVLYSYKIQESDSVIQVQLEADAYIRAAKNLAMVAEGDIDIFYKGLKLYQEGPLDLEVIQSAGVEAGTNEKTIFSMGILGMNMLFLSVYSSIYLLNDRENKTFYRVQISPLPQWNYMLQNILGFLIIMLIQMSGVFFIASFVLDLYLGVNVSALFVVMSVFAVVCVAFGVAVGSLSKNKRQAGATASMLITPMAMLGGMLWPKEIMPEILQHVSLFLPTTWLMDAVTHVVINGRILDVVWELFILFLFSTTLFLLGNWRKTTHLQGEN
ncbi:ABC transporter permease [Tindallia californiensis]|uniref:ABC-2 type transport system permease protein n=1 Tax=Tindallia californiensis TaxID=159292 RepID=A0A1H3IZ31_9FIRM|nr:ABC transporter permease [Tindallia californiensis]SDY33013.1 ABC-2 type transport system permease protein [Tindallia californiensis]